MALNRRKAATPAELAEKLASAEAVKEAQLYIVEERFKALRDEVLVEASTRDQQLAALQVEIGEERAAFDGVIAKYTP